MVYETPKLEILQGDSGHIDQLILDFVKTFEPELRKFASNKLPAISEKQSNKRRKKRWPYDGIRNTKTRNSTRR